MKRLSALLWLLLTFNSLAAIKIEVTAQAAQVATSNRAVASVALLVTTDAPFINLSISYTLYCPIKEAQAHAPFTQRTFENPISWYQFGEDEWSQELLISEKTNHESQHAGYYLSLAYKALSPGEQTKCRLDYKGFARQYKGNLIRVGLSSFGLNIWGSLAGSPPQQRNVAGSLEFVFKRPCDGPCTEKAM
jgi:hypothetical protein